MAYHPTIEKIPTKESSNTLPLQKKKTEGFIISEEEKAKTYLRNAAKRNTSNPSSYKVSQRDLPQTMLNAIRQLKDTTLHNHQEETKDNKEGDKSKQDKRPPNRENSFKNRKSDSKLVQVEHKIEIKTNDRFQNIFTSIIL